MFLSLLTKEGLICREQNVTVAETKAAQDAKIRLYNAQPRAETL